MSDSNETLAENKISARMKISPRPQREEGGALDSTMAPTHGDHLHKAVYKVKRDKDEDSDDEGDLHRSRQNSNPQAGLQGMNKEEGGKKVSKRRHWTPEEDAALFEAVSKYGECKWKAIADNVPGRNHMQCLQRWKKVLHPSIQKGESRIGSVLGLNSSG
eukprot:CAMPEP_0182483662 /NCGR_PEP_ID=MMETSP1319-20130603/41837_1 /TAXON_ID=172717 /ORGANISM="Bolidomonas pacifica, Strain RCC208" /LENGTH=159 /DNA_ID=CAMNT_0024685493 /DNA_START=80 /DNA_END=555 /DNA_ORIENTATION=+